MSEEEALQEIDEELERDRAYLNVLDILQPIERTRERFYYEGRIQVLKKLKEKLLDSGEG